MIDLDSKTKADLLGQIRDSAVKALIGDHWKDLELLSIQQVCGLLDVSDPILRGLPIPRINIVPGKVVRYRATDVAEFINSRAS